MTTMTMAMTARSDAAFALNLTEKDRVAIIAGSGRLPVSLATGLAGHGHPPFMVLVESESADDPDLTRFDHHVMRPEDIGSLVAVLKRARATHVVLAGGVSRRPDWRRLTPSLGLLALVGPLLKAAFKGDNGVLSLMVRHLEANGLKVVGAHEVLPDLLAGRGPLTRHEPSPRDRADLKAAFVAAKAIGQLDIGQAAVAIGRRAIALEGIEGTDGLLERVAGLRGHGRLAGMTGGVLVKCAKPGQELRADLPTIGPATVEAAHRAGLAGVAVEADHALILDQRRTVERADALGLFVTGLAPADLE
jgi:DUF1009 family protein